jgi:outer membrane protein TolC
LTTVEAAQKWAEAKDVLGVAKAAFDSAHVALEAAEKAEHEAWEALEELAGRMPLTAQIVEPEPQPQLQVWRNVPRVPGIG